LHSGRPVLELFLLERNFASEDPTAPRQLTDRYVEVIAAPDWRSVRTARVRISATR
jgi:hypothetical protein